MTVIPLSPYEITQVILTVVLIYVTSKKNTKK